MDALLSFAALAALGVQITSIITFLTAREPDRALKAVIPWVSLFAVLLLGSQADATADLLVPGLDTPLGQLDVPSLLLVAVAIGSSGSVAFVNFRKAIDRHDTAQEPPLGGPPV